MSLLVPWEIEVFLSFHLTKVLTGGEGGMLFNYNSSDKENFIKEIRGNTSVSLMEWQGKGD